MSTPSCARKSVPSLVFPRAWLYHGTWPTRGARKPLKERERTLRGRGNASGTPVLRSAKPFTRVGADPAGGLEGGLAVGDGEGEGDGDGDGDGLGIAVGDGEGDGEGLGLAVGEGDGEGIGSGPIAVQATEAIPRTSATRPGSRAVGRPPRAARL